ncbi:hypothetical protein GCM10009676_36470 [Prauserella halophila]|uniref:Uncharacterized protein n=2 Tax=Prauserella halophila TaxID=185641 RepID=A0ABN1WHD7_9PSEU
MRSRLRNTVLCCAVAVMSVSLSTTSVAAPQERESANERVAKVAAEYSAQHPHDYEGLERAIVAAGGDSVTIAVDGHGGVSAHEAQDLYEQAAAAESSGDVEPFDVPADAFNVSGSWYHIQDQYGEWWNATGTWNFRDNYVNGSAPRDASGIAADVPNCWVNDGEWIRAYDYQGNRYGGPLLRQNAGLTASVYAVEDATSNFAMLTDNGSHTVSFKRQSAGCAGQPLQARYYFEHNQDGGGGWSFGISVAGFSLTYSSGTPPTLQKATQVFRT